MYRLIASKFELVIWITALALLSGNTALYSKSALPDSDYRGRLAMMKPAVVGIPNTQNCSHRVGNVHFTITNWGFFGSNFADEWDALTEDYCLGPGVLEGELAPSFEFPAGSGVNYLYAGSLWFGAIVGDDTLVSFGSDGWMRTNEMYPTGAPDGGIIELSSRKTSEFYSEQAISEQDYIAEYTDTLSDQAYMDNDEVDNRPHIPLNIKVIQKTYSWSYNYAEDFVLLDFEIINMGLSELRRSYVAIYIDADIWDGITVDRGFTDDMSGYLHAVPHPACEELDDSINIAWIADFDGDPGVVVPGVFTAGVSPTAVAGTRVVRSPNPDLEFSFNWWVSESDVAIDWGPRRVENDRDWGHGGLGTPSGDRNKYYIMSRREFDYDQLWSDVDFTDQGWLPPNASLGSNLADGYDTRYLFSFGPFDIPPQDTLPITIAYVAGDRFHTNPEATKVWNSKNPQAYYDQLNFTDFGINAQWAGWVYDSPGVDTDDDGYAGEKIENPCKPGDSIYVSGDGIPDFSGPPPPPPPVLRFSASPGKVTVKWNGRESETEMDPFSFEVDFEGYSVYMADELQLSRFALLTTYDRDNYDKFELNTNFDPPRWELNNPPFTLQELEEEFAAVEDFDPDKYTIIDPLVVIVDGDTLSYYFEPHGYNRDDLDSTGQISRVYPGVTDTTELVWVEELNDYVPKAYEYEYTIKGLLPSKSIFMAVTTKDFGNPQTGLDPLESSPLANAIEVYPIWSNEEVVKQRLDVMVFPNPYKINAGYLEAGYEELDLASGASPERARRIHFANLPKEAIIRIYTLDGDLVRELRHPDLRLSEGESMIAWDLISKNTQAVVSGIYLYSVESELGNQVGKFVIIK
ncbi:MAG: hypothetical protein KAT58_04445 [candidate division Zixibacteria bacterium]|nr:hypothetical protein [candidate division Zixibacteria bacterium]